MGILSQTLSKLFLTDFDPKTDYKQGAEIGKGSFKTVFKADSPLNLTFVANSKSTNKKQPPQDNDDDGASIIHSGYNDSNIAHHPVAIAVAKPEDEASPDHIGIPVLQRKKINPSFIDIPFYHDDKREIRVLAKTDLSKYIKDPTLALSEEELQDQEKQQLVLQAQTPEGIKRILGQLVLAVESLHEENIVHRDIKPENVLITITHGKIHCQLTDLDGVCETDEKNILITDPNGIGETNAKNILTKNLTKVNDIQKCSPFYSAPELIDDSRAQTATDRPLRSTQRFATVDYKAVDIFALGVSFLSIVDSALGKLVYKNFEPRHYNAAMKGDNIPLGDNPKNTKEFDSINKMVKGLDPELKNLISSMFQPQPILRCTIKDIKKHAYFTKKNPNFFTELAEEFKHDVFVDNYYLRHPPVKKDPFFALPPKIKEVVIATKDLDNKVELLTAYLKSTSLSADVIEQWPVYWQGINLQAKETMSNINRVIADTDLKAHHEKVSLLQHSVREELRLLNKNMVKMQVQTIPCLDIHPLDLLEQINVAIDNYFIINNFDKSDSEFGLLEFNTKANKKRAVQLFQSRAVQLFQSIDGYRKSINSLVIKENALNKLLESQPENQEMLKIQLKNNIQQQQKCNTILFSIIIKTLKNNPEGKSEQALNTILQMHIGSQSDLEKILLAPAIVPIPSLDIDPQDLLEQIDTAIHNYLIVNGLDKSLSSMNIFDFEGKAKKIRANNLLFQIHALKEQIDRETSRFRALLSDDDPIPQQQLTNKLYLEIYKTLTDKKGGSSNQSLNTILQNHIGSLGEIKKLLKIDDNPGKINQPKQNYDAEFIPGYG